MDIKLYYQEKGTGEPLILLHGNGEDSSYFINQIDYFKNEYHAFKFLTPLSQVFLICYSRKT